MVSHFFMISKCFVGGNLSFRGGKIQMNNVNMWFGGGCWSYTWAKSGYTPQWVASSGPGVIISVFGTLLKGMSTVLWIGSGRFPYDQNTSQVFSTPGLEPGTLHFSAQSPNVNVNYLSVSWLFHTHTVKKVYFRYCGILRHSRAIIGLFHEHYRLNKTCQHISGLPQESYKMATTLLPLKVPNRSHDYQSHHKNI